MKRITVVNRTCGQPTTRKMDDNAARKLWEQIQRDGKRAYHYAAIFSLSGDFALLDDSIH